MRMTNRRNRRMVAAALGAVVLGMVIGGGIHGWQRATAAAAEEKPTTEPTAEDKRLVREYFDTHLGDKDYETVRWFVRPPNENGAHPVYVLVRYISFFGTPTIESYMIWINDGEVTAAYDRTPFPDSVEDKSTNQFQGYLRQLAGNGKKAPATKGNSRTSGTGGAAMSKRSASPPGQSVVKLPNDWEPPTTPLWVTLRDGGLVYGTITKTGEDDGEKFAIETRYGTLEMGRADIVGVRRTLPERR